MMRENDGNVPQLVVILVVRSCLVKLFNLRVSVGCKMEPAATFTFAQALSHVQTH